MTLHFSGRSLSVPGQAEATKTRKPKPMARPLLPFFALTWISLGVVGVDIYHWGERNQAEYVAWYAQEKRQRILRQAQKAQQALEKRESPLTARDAARKRKALLALEKLRLQSEQILAEVVRQNKGGTPPKRITAKQAGALWRGITFLEALRVAGPGYVTATEAKTNRPSAIQLIWWNEDKSYLMLEFEYGVVTSVCNNNLLD